MNTLHGLIFFGVPCLAVLGLGLRQRWGPIATFGGAPLAGAVVLALASPSANLGRADFGAPEAFALCAERLRSAASGRRATVPWVADSGTHGEHAFSWPTGAGLTLQRDGEQRDASAACIVEAATREVVHLTVDGVSLR
jgi:hypothetical protein